MNDLTPSLVRDFWSHMTGRFKASVVNKNSSLEMRAIATFLSLIKVANREAFLRSFATTVGRKIYVPFDIGTPIDGWSLWGQVTVCVHECHHVHQYDKLGAVMFNWQYLMSTARRALIEAEAYRCNMEIYWARTGQILSPATLAAQLKSYAVTDADVAVVERILSSSAVTIQQGGIASPASKEALVWLRQQGVVK